LIQIGNLNPLVVPGIWLIGLMFIKRPTFQLASPGLVAFPEMIAHLFYIFNNPKTTGIKFLMAQKFEVTILTRKSEGI